MKETSLLKNSLEMNEHNVDDQQSLSQRSIPIYKKDINGYTVIHNISSPSPINKHSNIKTCPSSGSGMNRAHIKKTISNLYFSNIATIKHIPLDIHVNKLSSHKSTVTTTPPTPHVIIKNKSAACLNNCCSISKPKTEKHKSFEEKASLTSRQNLFKHNISINDNSFKHRNSFLPSLQIFQMGSSHLKHTTTTSKLFGNMVVVNKVKESKTKQIRLITKTKQQQQQRNNNLKVHSICFNNEHNNKKESFIDALLLNESNKSIFGASSPRNINNIKIKLKFPIKLDKTKQSNKPRSLKEKYIQFINAKCELNKKVFPLNEAMIFDTIKSFRRKHYDPFDI